MVTSLCKARIPESCRYHGLGKDLPDKIYTETIQNLEQTNRNIHLWNTSEPDDFLTQIERNQASYIWNRAVKMYQKELKEEKLKQRKLPLLNDTKTLEDEIYNSAVNVFNSAENITIYASNHSTISLKLVANARYAKNNCAIVTKAILTNMSPEEFKSEQPLKAIRIDASDTKNVEKIWHHAAFIVTRNNEEYVVDYTIRQFDTKLPIPYVGKKEEWMVKVNEITGETWSDKPLQNWSIANGETKASLSMKLIP